MYWERAYVLSCVLWLCVWDLAVSCAFCVAVSGEFHCVFTVCSLWCISSCVVDVAVCGMWLCVAVLNVAVWDVTEW
jgi:hypothetical protein